MMVLAVLTTAIAFAVPASEALQADPEGGPEGINVDLHGSAVWAFAWGAASARNSFTGFERGEDFDLRDDFGLTQGAPLADLSLHVGFLRRHRVALHSLFGTFSARTEFDRTFEYNDGVFQQGEHAETRLEVDLRDVEYAYRFPGGRSIAFWAGGGTRWAHLNVGVHSSTLDPAGSMEENTAIFPTLVAGIELRPPSGWTLSLDLRGSPAAVPILFHNASRGRFIEAHASVQWSLTGFLKLETGGLMLWTWQRFRGREKDGHDAVNDVDIRIAGPSLGLEFSF